MRIKLDAHWTEILASLPESGMGYQLVDVTMRDGRQLRRAVALNAEWLEIPSDLAEGEIVDLRLHTGGSE